MSRQQYTLEFKDEAIRQVTKKGHSSLDYRSPLEFELKNGGVLPQIPGSTEWGYYNPASMPTDPFSTDPFFRGDFGHHQQGHTHHHGHGC